MSFDPKLGRSKVKKSKSGIPNTWTVSLPFPEEGSGICSSLCLLDPNYHLINICISKGKNSGCRKGLRGAAGGQHAAASGSDAKRDRGLEASHAAAVCGRSPGRKQRQRPAPEIGLGHRPWPPPGTCCVRLRRGRPAICTSPLQRVTPDIRVKYYKHVITAAETLYNLYRS